MALSRALRTLRSTSGALYTFPRIQALRIGCSYVAEVPGDEWMTLVRDPRRYQLVPIELSFGLERARSEYNASCLAVVRKTKRTHLGHRGGYSDLFLPVLDGHRLLGVVVAGPFLTHRPTAESLRREWQALSGAPADDGDEAFVRFVRGALESHVFEGAVLDALRSYLENFAAGLAGARGRSSGGARSIEQLLPESRLWDLAAEFVDPDRIAFWSASFKGTDRLYQGIWHMPNHVVAVAASERPGETIVQRLIRTDALQRACAALALALHDTISGRMGDEAAFFVTHVRAEPSSRLRSRLVALGERIVRQLRRRLGWDVVCGISSRAVHAAELPARYDEATWAVVWGLHRNERVMFYDATEPVSPAGLYRSAQELCTCFASARAKETVLCAEKVAHDVLWVSGGSIEAMRSHLLEVFFRLVSIADQRNVVDESTSSEMLRRATTGLGRAGTTAEAATAFTELVRELMDVLSRPSALGRRTKLERARRYVEQAGRGERVTLQAVAKRVGLSAPYLSRCFKRQYQIEFGQFVLQSRVEHAKKLLYRTALRVVEVSAEAGFSSPSYFHQAFHRVTGMTPEQYRRAERVVLPARPPPGAVAP